MEDPFAQPAPAASYNTTNTNPKEKTVTENNTNAKVTATLKGGSGFDAPWIVLHGDTPAEVLDQLNDQVTKELIEQTQKVGQYFAGLGKPAPAAGGGGGRAPRAGQPTGAANLELSDKDLDQLEERFGSREVPAGWDLRSGVGKSNGKPWRAVMPPRGSDEKPLFFRG